MAVPHDMVMFSFMLFGKKHSAMTFMNIGLNARNIGESIFMIFCFPKTESPIPPKPPIFIFGRVFGKMESSSRAFLIWRFCKGEEEKF